MVDCDIIRCEIMNMSFSCDKCVFNTWCDITCIVSYELYNNPTSVYLEKSGCAMLKGKCRLPI